MIGISFNKPVYRPGLSAVNQLNQAYSGLTINNIVSNKSPGDSFDDLNRVVEGMLPCCPDEQTGNNHKVQDRSETMINNLLDLAEDKLVEAEQSTENAGQLSAVVLRLLSQAKNFLVVNGSGSKIKNSTDVMSNKLNKKGGLQRIQSMETRAASIVGNSFNLNRNVFY